MSVTEHKCSTENRFIRCVECGKRGLYCYEEPIGSTARRRLLSLIDAIGVYDIGELFTSDIWQEMQHDNWYHETMKMLNWLEYCGLVECVKRSKKGNLWRRTI